MSNFKTFLFALNLVMLWLATPLAHGQIQGVNFTPLGAFNNTNNGANPYAPPVLGADGNLYGTMPYGGTNNIGVIFKVTTNGSSGSHTTLYTFKTNFNSLGVAKPFAPLASGQDGNLYGVASSGGTNSLGTIFEITTNGAFTLLYSFGMMTNALGYALDGSTPYGGLVQGRDGYFYGMTYSGGISNVGTVFQFSTNGTLTTLHSFTGDGANDDGAYPVSQPLVEGADGVFYGTTSTGGTNNDGTIFQITVDGADSVLTNLFEFNNTDGRNPYAGLSFGSDGNLYGTTVYGGTNGYGTAFQITTNGVLTTLFEFGGPEALYYPEGGVVPGNDNTLFGTTYYDNQYGAVFQLTTNGVLTKLHSFTNGIDGANPYAGVIRDASGNLYGTALYGGTNGGYGTVYSLSFTTLISILLPTANELWSNSVFTVTGTASDNAPGGAITNVLYSLNGAAWTNATTVNGWINWTADVALARGSNILQAVAVDGAGNISATDMVTFVNVTTPPLTGSFSNANWIGFGGLGSAVIGQINAVVCDGSGNLYVASDNPGGYNSVISEWNGYTWSLLTTNTDFPVYALACDANGNLYAGGAFTTVGGVGANSIAEWNGNTWSPLGSGFINAGEVYALAFDKNGNLYAGGYFETAGGVSATNIAKWNGTNWSALGSGVGTYLPDEPNEVLCVACDKNGNLYTGGQFSMAGGVSATNIAKWNGSAWSTLGSGIYDLGLDDEVNALACDTDDNLYAGGEFGTAGGVSAILVAKWNGSAWSALGSGLYGVVLSLACDSSGNLYAGGGSPGAFSSAGGGDIAKWNGNFWSTLGSGMSGSDSTGYTDQGANSYGTTVNALALDGFGDLYASGNFYKAGTNIAYYVAEGVLTRYAVTTFALPNGTNGAGYSQQLSAVNGQPPYSWSIFSGSLPSGLSLATSGLISGTPTNSGIFNFTVKVTDALSETTTQPLTLTVIGFPSVAIQPTNNSVTLTAGANVSIAVTVAGIGPFSYQWQLNGTNLPNGIISTVAGGGNQGLGDGGAATNAELNYPADVALDTTGNLFIADFYNSRIRKVIILGQTLVLNGVGFGNAGGYDVVVSSPYGSVTSSVVNLTITLPVILSEPEIAFGKTNFTFLLSGPAGSNYVLQVSTNLLNWSSVSTSTIPVRGIINLRNAIGGYDRQFYRAYLQ